MNEEYQSAQGQIPAPPKARTRDDILSDIQSGADFLENQLAQELSQMVENDPSLEDLFFEDKVAFFKRILDVVSDEMEERFINKHKELAEFDNNAQLEGKMQALEQAKNAFQEAHPDIDADMIMALYLDLPPQMQKQLDSLPPQMLFDELYKLYQQQGGTQQTQEQLPQQLNGMPSETSELEPELDLPTTRY